MFAVPPVWTFKPTLSNFQEAFLEKGFLKFLLNSSIFAAASTAASMLIGVPAAYALTRFKIRGQSSLFIYILSTDMAPPIVFAVPLYLMFSKFSMIDSYPALISAHILWSLAFVIWMMKGFFEEVPREIDEAAQVDGCSVFQAFFRVLLPVAAPGAAATAIFALTFSWNEFVYALTLTGRSTRTLPVAIPGLVTPLGTLWGQIAAISFVITIPVVVFTFVMQKYMVRGLTFGAVKG